MSLPPRASTLIVASCLLLASAAAPGRSDDEAGWVDLTNLEAWRGPIEGCSIVGSVALDPADPKLLAGEAGSGILLALGPKAKAKNLISRQSFGDVELHAEFNVPKGSNSGIKFHSVYEVQLFDSFGATRKMTGRECGGVYPRSEEKPKYHQIDDGSAPLVNACLAPGEWQVLDVTFRTARFDASGKKVECARITAVLNGKTVQDNLEVHSPTGSAWRDAEKATGPLLVQLDHGPVAFRNLRARPLPSKP